MPLTGPVAYQVQSGSFTAEVISAGAAQVRPSSSLWVTQTVRVGPETPAGIRLSGISPGLRVNSSQMVLVRQSTTGAGLPIVSGPKSATRIALDQVRPPSALRFTSTSMSPA